MKLVVNNTLTHEDRLKEELYRVFKETSDETTAEFCLHFASFLYLNYGTDEIVKRFPLLFRKLYPGVQAEDCECCGQTMLFVEEDD